MLFNEEITITLGNKKIVEESLITLDKNIKYAIIGPNGIGKTTILNHIYEKIKNDNNALYITQAEKLEDTCTIYEYMLKSNSQLYEKYIRYKELEEKVNDNTISEDLFEEYNQLDEYLRTERFEQYKGKAIRIAKGLGFEDLTSKVNLLSGGQHTKLALCKALLLEPELLLLDEPTNHLDLNNIIWLEQYLVKYKKGLIIISHNINFLDSICDKTFYFFNIDPQKPQVFSCKGGYDNFEKTFKQKTDGYIKEYEKQLKRLAELKKKQDKTELEKYKQKTQLLNRPIRDYNININFNDVKSLAANNYTNIISFNDVSFGYDKNNMILEKINIGISMSSRYVLVGPNGCGKTTFFNLCTRTLQPDSGEIIFDNRIRIGYFNQKSITELPENLNPIQYLQTVDSSLDQQMCRKILAGVGFKKMYEGDDFDVSKLLISELSGGQKVKLVLCGIKIRDPHIILFDEPTNHLDIYSINQFIESINDYNGGVVIITHDRYIIENIDNYELLILQNKQISKYDGDFDDYCDEIVDEDDE